MFSMDGIGRTHLSNVWPGVLKCIATDIWEASIGEELICVRETSNAKDPFAVAVVKNEVIVAHIPMY